MGGMSSMAASDINNDGLPEIALAYGFRANEPDYQGGIAVLQALGDARGIWMLKNVNRIAPTRRVLWAEIEGVPTLVDAPAMHPASVLFEESGELSTPVILYQTSAMTPERTTWEGRDRVRELLISNSGEIVKGQSGRNQFFGAVSDNALVIYRQGDGGAWESTILDRNLPNGRVLLAIDINGDGSDELVASSAGGSRRIYLYRTTDPDGNAWQRTLLDESMGARHCVAADLSGDKKPDIACIDNVSPFSIHWYENFPG
jgi:hypothetical protein